MIFQMFAPRSAALVARPLSVARTAQQTGPGRAGLERRDIISLSLLV